MRTFFTLGTLLMSFFASATEIRVPVDTVYAPKGFDTNDNVEVVVSGYLPNLCYKNPKAKFKIEGSTVQVELTADYQSEQGCAEVVLPFIEPISLETLDKGWYDVKVNGQEGTSVFVAESTSDARDEFIYANVEYVEKDAKTRTITLKGHNPSDCLVFDKIEITDNGKDVYSILPKMKQVSDFCPMKMVPFEFEKQLPNTLEGRVLLHVRAMDGKSVNSLFDDRWVE